MDLISGLWCFSCWYQTIKMSWRSRLAGGSLEGAGGIGVCFPRLTLPLSCAVFSEQEGLSSFIDLFLLAPFCKVLCITLAHQKAALSLWPLLTQVGVCKSVSLPVTSSWSSFAFCFLHIQREVAVDTKKILTSEMWARHFLTPSH